MLGMGGGFGGLPGFLYRGLEFGATALAACIIAVARSCPFSCRFFVFFVFFVMFTFFTVTFHPLNLLYQRSCFVHRSLLGERPEAASRADGDGRGKESGASGVASKLG